MTELTTGPATGPAAWLALTRYLTAAALRSGRWVNPGVLFFILTVAGTPFGGSALDGYGFTVMILLPIAMWATIAVVNSEDPIQVAITTVTAGSALAVRTATLAVVYLFCLPLTLFGVAWPLATGHHAGPAEVLAGILAHLLSALAGVAIGSLLSRPLLTTPTWVPVLAIPVVLIEILVPGFPPVRAIASAFTASNPSAADLFGTLSLVGVETVLGTAVLVAAGHRRARDRA